jgi:hypothetical protein
MSVKLERKLIQLALMFHKYTSIHTHIHTRIHTHRLLRARSVGHQSHAGIVIERQAHSYLLLPSVETDL